MIGGLSVCVPSPTSCSVVSNFVVCGSHFWPVGVNSKHFNPKIVSMRYVNVFHFLFISTGLTVFLFPLFYFLCGDFNIVSIFYS